MTKYNILLPSDGGLVDIVLKGDPLPARLASIDRSPSDEWTPILPLDSEEDQHVVHGKQPIMLANSLLKHYPATKQPYSDKQDALVSTTLLVAIFGRRT